MDLIGAELEGRGPRERRRSSLSSTSSHASALSVTPSGHLEDSDGEEESSTPSSDESESGPAVDPVQGIPWRALRLERRAYRQERSDNYQPFHNMRSEVDDLRRIADEAQRVCESANLFGFEANDREVAPVVSHFQLRNLVAAPTEHDVYVTGYGTVLGVCTASGRRRSVLDLANSAVRGKLEAAARRRGVPAVDGDSNALTTLAAQQNVLVVGGMWGQLVTVGIPSGVVHACDMISDSTNPIVNSIRFEQARDRDPESIIVANNDHSVYRVDLCTGYVATWATFDWSVNLAEPRVDGKLVCIAADDPDIRLYDTTSPGLCMRLKGHLDCSFAAAWHPNGHLLATGNQDLTTRVWDIRKPDRSVAVLPCMVGGSSVLHFSPDGELLAMGETDDFVQVFDVSSGFTRAQVIDLFGMVAGVAFTPTARRLRIAMHEPIFSSLCTWRRVPVGRATADVLV